MNHSHSTDAIEPCDLCNSCNYMPVAVEKGHTIYRCRQCGLVQVRPIPADTTIENSEYWHVDIDDPQVQVSRLGSQKVFSSGIDLIERCSGRSIQGKKILDVGCGMGLFLEVAQQRGAQIHGIDITPEAVSFTRKLCGVETIRQGSFEQSCYSAGEFDVVTGWNMLHSVNSPSAWLQKSHELLRDRGTLLLKVPNVAFFGLLHQHPKIRQLAKIPDTPYLTTVPPLALYGYTPRTLRHLLIKNGFEVQWIGCSAINEKRGMQAKVSEILRLVSSLTFGRVNLYPVTMAIARKLPN